MHRGAEALQVSAAELGRHGDVWAHLGVGRLYLVKSDLARAIAVLERGLPMCEVGGDLAVYFSRTAASLGGAYALAGRLDEALELLGPRGSPRRINRIRIWSCPRGRYTRRGEAAGERCPRRGPAPPIEPSRSRRLHGQRGWEAWTLRLAERSRCHSVAPDVDIARANFDAATALARNRDMRGRCWPIAG
jgi:hypothetical protein